MVHGSLASLAKVVRGSRLPRKKAVELTDAAAERIRMLLEKRHKVCGGCGRAAGAAPTDWLHTEDGRVAGLRQLPKAVRVQGCALVSVGLYSVHLTCRPCPCALRRNTSKWGSSSGGAMG